MSSYTEKLEAAVAKKKEELTAYEPYMPDERMMVMSWKKAKPIV